MGVLAEVLELGVGADHRDRGARPGRARAGAPPVPFQRRRPVPARGMGRRGVRPLGLRRGAPELVPAGGHRGQHLAGRPGPDPARGDHGRRAAAAVRRDAPARRRRQRRHRAGGTPGRVRRPAAAARSTTSPAPRTVDGWATTLATISDSLTATSARDAWQRAELTALLDEPGRRGDGRDDVTSPVALSCDDVRSILADRLKGRPTRANFCTGHLTVCTLVPMRSIPHRVVCLLGLDDGSFPRHIERDGDDLTARNQRVGDRDVRSEDRQLLLDALLAARDHLVVTYTGRDERSNLPRPPAVPVGELLDVVDHTVRVADGTCARRHRGRAPAAALRPAELRAGRAGSGPALELRPLHLAGARAALVPRHGAPAFLEQPLAPYDVELHRARPARALPAPSRAGLPARAARHLAARQDPGLRGRDPDRPRRAGANGRSPTASSRRGSPGPAWRRAWPPSGPAGRSRRAGWPTRCSSGSPIRSTTSWRPGKCAEPPSSLDVHVDLPRPAHPGRHRGRRARRRRAHRDLLQARARRRA